MTLDIIYNDGRFGPGRMDWLLVLDGQLVSHCGLYSVLDGLRARLRAEAWKRICGDLP